MTNLEKYAFIGVGKLLSRFRGKPALNSLDDIISGSAARLHGRAPRSPNAAAKALTNKEKFLNQQIDSHLGRHQARIGEGARPYPTGGENQFYRELAGTNPAHYNSRASIINRQIGGWRDHYAKQFANYVPVGQRPIMKDWVKPGLGLAGLGGGGYLLNNSNNNK